MILTSSPQLQLLNYSEAARQLCVSVRTLRRFVRSGEIECVRFGSAVRFTPRQLEQFVAARITRRRR